MPVDANERLRTLQLQTGAMLVLIAIQLRRKRQHIVGRKHRFKVGKIITGRILGLFTHLSKSFNFMTESSFIGKPSRDAPKAMF